MAAGGERDPLALSVSKMTLDEFFKEHPRAAIAFSGGVDSAYLLCAALRAGAEVRAYCVHSAFQPAFERAEAEALARQLGATLRMIPVDVLSDPAVAENGPERCYYCKKRMFTAIAEQAAADGFSLLLDGTNASDDAADRPGMRALRELSVRSPLRECGLTKAEIRRRSRAAGLPTWNKSAYACLATRTPTGTALCAAGLARTERAEDFLAGLGFRDFRVRTVGNGAKLELRASQLPLLLERREEIVQRLREDYDSVLLNLEVRGEPDEGTA